MALTALIVALTFPLVATPKRTVRRAPSDIEVHDSPTVTVTEDDVMIEPGVTGTNFKFAQTRAGFHGIRTVLVIRIEALDTQSSMSSDELSDSLFGTSGKKINMKERFEKCSFGDFKMEPFINKTETGFHVTNGVVEVKINDTLLDKINPEEPKGGYGGVWTKDAALREANTILGSRNQFDYHMLSIPRNVSVGASAMATVGGSQSWYADGTILLPEFYMHEITHCLGFGHANEMIAGKEHDGADSSGAFNGQLAEACFNGAINWHLGWYANAYASVYPLGNPWTGRLIGLASYGDAGAVVGNYVVVQLQTGCSIPGCHNYYVSFNLKRGVNNGTAEGANQVLVHSTGAVWAGSRLWAKLYAGDTYVVPFFGGTSENVHIRVDDIDLSADTPHAEVSIYPETDFECTAQHTVCDETICPGDEQCRDYGCSRCGSSCTSKEEAQECCDADDECTAVFGNGRDWWTFNDVCTESRHSNSYSTCHKSHAGYNCSAPFIVCEETNKCGEPKPCSISSWGCEACDLPHVSLCRTGQCRDHGCSRCTMHGAQLCTTQEDAQECCDSDDACTAVYGNKKDWWTFYGACTTAAHSHDYRTCHKSQAGYNCTSAHQVCVETQDCHCDATPCNTQATATLCCRKDAACTAIVGGGSSWATVQGACTDRDQYELPYITCHRGQNHR